MNERAKELLSAYLDDGLSAVEAEELASLWGENLTLAAQGSRYVQVGELLRMNAGIPVQPQAATLLERVQRALESEAPVAVDAPDAERDPVVRLAVGGAPASAARLQPLESARRRWSRPAAGLALAAAVAMVALGGLRLLNTAPTTSPVSLASTAPGAVAPTLASTAPALASDARDTVMGLAQAGPFRWSVAEPEVEQRLNRYLVNHSEVTRSGTHGVLPYARVIGYRGSSAAGQQ